jgi:hypothetical protein
MQLVRLSHQLSGSRLSFHPLPGKGHLAAGFLTSYMAAGFPSVYCQVRGSWQQVLFRARLLAAGFSSKYLKIVSNSWQVVSLAASQVATLSSYDKKRGS